MAKLDRLGWAGGLATMVHGVSIGIRFTDPAFGERVQERLPTGWSPRRRASVDHLVSIVVGGEGAGGRVRRYHLLYSGSVLAFRTLHVEELLNFLEFHLEQYVAQEAPRRLFVHAGVVGWKGRAILLPGASHSGKTTLVAALLRAGARYYSDEYALLDPEGRAHPYPRALRLRGGSDVGETVPASAFGAPLGRRPLRVGLVVLAPYAAGAAWKPGPLSRGQGVLRLLANTLPARRRPLYALKTLKAAVSSASIIEGARGDAEEVAGSLLAMAE